MILDCPRSPGFSSTSTRRSASLAVIRLARLHHGGADVGEAPGRRAAGAARLGRHQVGERGPERREVLLADALVEGRAAPAFPRGAP